MRVMDCTLGFGGHSLAMLEKAGGDLELLGLDRDGQALALAGERLAPYGDRVRLAESAFGKFPRVLDELGWDGVDVALVDAGVSSMHLDDPERGFSFLADGPLDMRMGPGEGLAPAVNLVNKASFADLRRIIRKYGEDPQAGRIAKAIVRAREKGRIKRTLELAEIISAAYPAKWRATARRHPATRTFQALRMVVNRELEELEAFLGVIPDHLRPGGRVAVISFHSLEDRLVKRSFRHEATGCLCPRNQHVCVCGHVARFKLLTKKPIVPTEEEVGRNSRAGSAKLRAAERLPDPVGPRGER